MTGTASGKLEFDAKVYLNDAELADAQVYVHLKGFCESDSDTSRLRAS